MASQAHDGALLESALHRSLIRQQSGSILLTPSAAGDSRRFDDDDVIPVDLFGPKLRREHSSFSLSTFVFELLTQTFHPFLLPWVIRRQNWQAAVNKGFVPGKPGIFITNTVFHILMYLPLCLVAVQHPVFATKRDNEWPNSPTTAPSPSTGADFPLMNSAHDDSDHQRITFSVSWSVLVMSFGTAFALFRIMVIAGKYACFPKHIYRRLLWPEEDVTARLLLATWSGNVPESVLREELDMAEELARVSLRRRYFLLADGKTSISAHVYALELSRRTFGSSVSPLLLHFGKAMGVCVSLLPLWVFLREPMPDSERNHPLSISIVSISVLQTLVFGIPVFGFLSVAIQHHLRFASMHRGLLNALMLTGGQRRIERPLHDEFMIPLRNPNNLVVWVFTRHALKFFARSYANRVSFNLFAMLVVCGVMALILVQQAFSSYKNVPLITACGLVFLIIMTGCLVTVLFAFRSDFSGHAVLRLIADEQLSILWEQMLMAQRRKLCDSYRMASASEGVTAAPSKPQEANPALPRVLDSNGFLAEDRVPSTDGEDEELESSPGGFQRRPRSRSSVIVNACDTDALAEFQSAAEIVREVVSASNDSDPVTVMFVPASPELIGFILSVFLTGMMLVVAVFTSTVGRGFIPGT